MNTLKLMLFSTIFIGVAYAAPEKPPQDVNVVNTPNVTIANPQTSVTVDNDSTSPVPVTVENQQTSVTVDNSEANPIPIVTPQPIQVKTGTNYRFHGTSTNATLPYPTGGRVGWSEYNLSW